MIFTYGNEEIAYLQQKDEKLAKLICLRGIVEREMIADPFEALVQSILSQQISTKAFCTLLQRLRGGLPNACISVANILALSPEQIKNFGMTQKKAENIYTIAHLFATKELDPKKWEIMQDKEIIKELTKLRGIGVWSAEMFLLFCLGRKNILSYGDYGIKKGLCILYRLEKIVKKDFKYFEELYSPYCSVASLYLWELANGNCTGFTQS